MGLMPVARQRNKTRVGGADRRGDVVAALRLTAATHALRGRTWRSHSSQAHSPGCITATGARLRRSCARRGWTERGGEEEERGRRREEGSGTRELLCSCCWQKVYPDDDKRAAQKFVVVVVVDDAWAPVTFHLRNRRRSVEILNLRDPPEPRDFSHPDHPELSAASIRADLPRLRG